MHMQMLMQLARPDPVDYCFNIVQITWINTILLIQLNIVIY